MGNSYYPDPREGKTVVMIIHTDTGPVTVSGAFDPRGHTSPGSQALVSGLVKRRAKAMMTHYRDLLSAD